MKTAELFHKYADQWEIRPDGSDLTKSIVIEDFEKALVEHDAEIIKLIDGMILEKEENITFLLTHSPVPEDDGLLKVRRCVLRSKIGALQELKQKIEKL